MLSTFAFVILILFKELLLIYQMILISSQSLDLLIQLFQLESLFLLLHLDLTVLSVSRLLQRCQICHQSVVFFFVKFEFFLLCLRGALLLFQFDRVLVHGISVQEFLIATQTDGATALTGRVVLGVGARLRQASGTILGAAELATNTRQQI